MAKTTKPRKKPVTNPLAYRTIFVVAVSVFVTTLLCSALLAYFEKTTVFSPVAKRTVAVQTTDGLMGLIGEEATIKPGQVVVYTVDYSNASSNDLFITIKATQREHDYSKKWCKGAYCDLGAWTGSAYSEKKLVKKGESTQFVVPVTPSGTVATGSVELEAFKTTQD